VSEWINLDHTISVTGYAVNGISTIDERGSGEAVLLSLMTKGDGVFHFMLNPDLAHLISWEAIGIVKKYAIPSTDLNGQLEDFDDSSIWDELEEEE